MQVIWDLVGENKVDNLHPCWTGQSKGQNVHAGYLDHCEDNGDNLSMLDDWDNLNDKMTKWTSCPCLENWDNLKDTFFTD
jgi:hypothetical protein